MKELFQDYWDMKDRNSERISKFQMEQLRVREARELDAARNANKKKISVFYDRLGTRIQDIKNFACLYPYAKALSVANRYGHQEIIANKELDGLLRHNVDQLAPFKNLAQVARTVETQLDLAVGLNFYLQITKQKEISSVNIESLGFISSILTSYICYFLASGLRGSNEYFGLVEITPLTRLDTLFQSDDREKKLVNAFCINQQNCYWLPYLRHMGALHRALPPASVFFDSENHWIKQLRQGKDIDLMTLNQVILNDSSKSRMGACINYFLNSNGDYQAFEGIADNLPSLYSLFLVLTIIESSAPTYFSQLISQLRNYQSGVRFQPSAEEMENFNSIFGFFPEKGEYFSGEVAWFTRQLKDPMGITPLFPLELTEQDLPTLHGFFSSSSKTPSLEGDLAQFFYKEQ